jgi:hypothetical protein
VCVLEPFDATLRGLLARLAAAGHTGGSGVDCPVGGGKLHEIFTRLDRGGVAYTSASAEEIFLRVGPGGRAVWLSLAGDALHEGEDFFAFRADPAASVRKILRLLTKDLGNLGSSLGADAATIAIFRSLPQVNNSSAVVDFQFANRQPAGFRKKRPLLGQASLVPTLVNHRKARYEPKRHECSRHWESSIILGRVSKSRQSRRLYYLLPSAAISVLPSARRFPEEAASFEKCHLG